MTKPEMARESLSHLEYGDGHENGYKNCTWGDLPQICACSSKIASGCKENHFSSLSFGQAEASIY